MKSIGRNIKQIRMQKSMTQETLAEKLYVSRQTISNYENGKSQPDVDMIMKLAEVFQTDANSIIYGPTESRKSKEYRNLIIGICVSLVSVLLGWLSYYIIYRADNYAIYLGKHVIKLVFYPVVFLSAGWSLFQLLSLFINLKPLVFRQMKFVRIAVYTLLSLLILLPVPYIIFDIVGICRVITSDSVSMLFPYIPVYSDVTPWIIRAVVRVPGVYTLFGAVCWLLGKNNTALKP